MKGVATCRRCGFQWVRGADEARWARMCEDCATVDLHPKPAEIPLNDPRQPLVTYLGARVASLSYAVRLALGAMRMGKYAEAERVLRDVA